MKLEILNDEMLKRYLLDDVSDDERENIEERFLQDDSFFDGMLALEDELHYEYRQDRLNALERNAFERKFLQSARDREKSAFADAFLQATAELAKEKATYSKKNVEDSTASWRQSIVAFFSFSSPVMQFGMAAASVLLMLGVIGLFVQNSRMRNEMASLENNRAEEIQRQEQIIVEKQRQKTEFEQQLAAEKQQSRQNEERIREIETKRSQLEQEIAGLRRRVEQTPPSPVSSPPQQQPQQRAIIALSLAPGLLNRSGGTATGRIKILPAVKTLQVRLLLKDANEYQSYRATVSNIDEGEVWTGLVSKAQGKGAKKSVSLSIPASVLRRADYEILLVGVMPNGQTEEMDSYYFSVLK